MSLEAAIHENTQAIQALIAALGNGIPTTAAQVAAVVQEAEKPAKAEAKKAKEAAAPAPTLNVVDNSTTSSADDKPGTAPTAELFAQAVAVLNTLISSNRRAQAAATLAWFGVARLSEASAAQVPEILNALTAAAAG